MQLLIIYYYVYVYINVCGKNPRDLPALDPPFRSSLSIHLKNFVITRLSLWDDRSIVRNILFLIKKKKTDRKRNRKKIIRELFLIKTVWRTLTRACREERSHVLSLFLSYFEEHYNLRYVAFPSKDTFYNTYKDLQ